MFIFMKSQIELAKEKGIEVGDRVKVVASHYSRGGDYPVADWTEVHDVFLGKEITVASITDWGIRAEALTFPVQSLEKVEDEVKLPEVPSWDADRVHISVQMTKREYFAAMAMQGLVTADILTKHHRLLAIQSIGIADALIVELNKGEGV